MKGIPFSIRNGISRARGFARCSDDGLWEAGAGVGGEGSMKYTIKTVKTTAAKRNTRVVIIRGSMLIYAICFV
jgi:hypothetical protein